MGSRNGIEKVAAKKAGVSAAEWWQRRTAGEQWCYCCRRWLLVKRFGVDRSRSGGRASACKECVSHKGTASRYGITVVEARALRSGGRQCDICGRTRKLEVDHNHSTGKVRGVLCSRCNGALGQFCDDARLLLKAVAYLEERNG